MAEKNAFVPAPRRAHSDPLPASSYHQVAQGTTVDAFNGHGGGYGVYYGDRSGCYGGNGQSHWDSSSIGYNGSGFPQEAGFAAFFRSLS
jgi:hypothetical protein